MKREGPAVKRNKSHKRHSKPEDQRPPQDRLQRVDSVEAIEGIRKGLADVKHGRTRPVRAALEDLRRKYEVK